MAGAYLNYTPPQAAKLRWTQTQQLVEDGDWVISSW